jgi:N-acetylglucosamine kinase-like BadF-type ATPase
MGSELLGKNVSQFDNGGMMNPYSSAVNSFRKALDNRIAAGKQLEGVVNMRKKRFTQGGRF